MTKNKKQSRMNLFYNLNNKMVRLYPQIERRNWILEELGAKSYINKKW